MSKKVDDDLSVSTIPIDKNEIAFSFQKESKKLTRLPYYKLEELRKQEEKKLKHPHKVKKKEEHANANVNTHPQTHAMKKKKTVLKKIKEEPRENGEEVKTQKDKDAEKKTGEKKDTKVENVGDKYKTLKYSVGGVEQKKIKLSRKQRKLQEAENTLASFLSKEDKYHISRNNYEEVGQNYSNNYQSYNNGSTASSQNANKFYFKKNSFGSNNNYRKGSFSNNSSNITSGNNDKFQQLNNSGNVIMIGPLAGNYPNNLTGIKTSNKPGTNLEMIGKKRKRLNKFKKAVYKYRFQKKQFIVNNLFNINNENQEADEQDKIEENNKEGGKEEEKEIDAGIIQETDKFSLKLEDIPPNDENNKILEEMKHNDNLNIPPEDISKNNPDEEKVVADSSIPKNSKLINEKKAQTVISNSQENEKYSYTQNHRNFYNYYNYMNYNPNMNQTLNYNYHLPYNIPPNAYYPPFHYPNGYYYPYYNIPSYSFPIKSEYYLPRKEDSNIFTRNNKFNMIEENLKEQTLETKNNFKSEKINGNPKSKSLPKTNPNIKIEMDKPQEKKGFIFEKTQIKSQSNSKQQSKEYMDYLKTTHHLDKDISQLGGSEFQNIVQQAELKKINIKNLQKVADQELLKEYIQKFEGIQPETNFNSKIIREYVDQILDKEVDKKFGDFIVKMRDIYFKKKASNPLKAKRRFVVGMREVEKHIKLEDVKCLFIVPNVEKVEGENSLDERLLKIFKDCGKQTIPIIFGLNKFKLGKLARKKNSAVSVLAFINVEGFEREFKDLLDFCERFRQMFYQKYNDKREIFADNKFINIALFDVYNSDKSGKNSNEH